MAVFFEIDRDEINYSSDELQKRLCVTENFDLSLIKSNLDKVKTLITPKCSYAVTDIICSDDCVNFGFMTVKSKSLAKLASCYKKAVFFAVTLGFSLEREQMRLSKLGGADFFISDAAGSSVAEDVCNTAQEKIKDIIGKEYEYSRRFSPGYGDFELGVQQEVLDFLEAKNLLGITLSTSLLMIPQKSITAVMFFDKK